jgi:transcriptional regulator with XRE-family HTH domain
MNETFSPAKISAQVKVLAPLDGQAAAIHRKFSMAKTLEKREEKVQTRFKQPRFRPTFIKQWRKKKGWNQGKLADAIGVSTATISQIENGETGYKQEHLEAIAEALGCLPADLLMRNPTDPEAIWSLWESAKPAQRKQIIGIIKGLLGSEAA